MNNKQVIKIKNSDMHNLHIRKLNNADENFLTESGVYKLVFKSHKPNAEAFTAEFSAVRWLYRTKLHRMRWSVASGSTVHFWTVKFTKISYIHRWINQHENTIVKI